MIWSRIPFLQALFAPAPVTDPQVVDAALRWKVAAEREPELAEDLIRLSGLLQAQAVTAEGVVPMDASRLAYEAGRRDFGLQLLAMMYLDPAELNSLMRDTDERTRRRDTPRY